MFEEDLDIGFYVEDVYAAYITHVATQLQLTPEFRSARGASVDVRFTGPLLPLADFRIAANTAASSSATQTAVWEQVAQLSLSPVSPSPSVTTVELHGWIEKLNGAQQVQLTERIFYTAGRTGPLGETEKKQTVQPRHHRVLGSLDFMLHLSTHDLLLGRSGSESDSLTMDQYDRPLGSQDAGEGNQKTQAARDVLEQKDEMVLTRNAVDTVIKFARMVEDHPAATATVYMDEEHHVEHLVFDT